MGSLSIFVSYLDLDTVWSWRLDSANLGRMGVVCAHADEMEAYLLWVLESTMSRNSWLVGTAGMSFHWVFILATAALLWSRTRSALRREGLAKSSRRYLSIPKNIPHRQAAVRLMCASAASRRPPITACLQHTPGERSPAIAIMQILQYDLINSLHVQSNTWK